MSAAPHLDISVADLAAPDRRRTAVARLSGMMLYPDDAARWARWEQATLAVARKDASAAGEVIQVEPQEMYEGLFAAGGMLREATARAAACVQAGRVYADCLTSNQEAGYGVLIDHHGLPPMNLKEAKLRHARARPPNLRAEIIKKSGHRESLASVDKRVWNHRGAFAHLCAAHVVICGGRAFQIGQFPCQENHLRDFLRMGEVIRRAALRVRLQGGVLLRGRERLLALPAPVLDAVRRWPGDEFLPERVRFLENIFPCSGSISRMVA